MERTDIPFLIVLLFRHPYELSPCVSFHNAVKVGEEYKSLIVYPVIHNVRIVTHLVEHLLRCIIAKDMLPVDRLSLLYNLICDCHSTFILQHIIPLDSSAVGLKLLLNVKIRGCV